MISILKKLAVGLLLASVACSQSPDDEQVSVVAAFYPIAEAARAIGGGPIEVTDLTPPGVEPHDLELTPEAFDKILDADVVIYIRGFQPAIDDAVAKTEARVIDLSYRADDPHIWLDPVAWSEAVDEIARELDVSGEAYVDRLHVLSRSYDKGLADCERDLVVTAHDAFGRLADRYGLRVESIAGISPEAEPNPKRLAELADLVKRQGVTTIFAEELVSPKVAEALADEAGVTTGVLDPIESEPEGGYFGAMGRNLAALREGLGCR